MSLSMFVTLHWTVKIAIDTTNRKANLCISKLKILAAASAAVVMASLVNLVIPSHWNCRLDYVDGTECSMLTARRFRCHWYYRGLLNPAIVRLFKALSGKRKSKTLKNDKIVLSFLRFLFMAFARFWKAAEMPERFSNRKWLMALLLRFICTDW